MTKDTCKKHHEVGYQENEKLKGRPKSTLRRGIREEVRNTNSTNLVVMNQNREDEEISFSMVYNPSEAKSLSK